MKKSAMIFIAAAVLLVCGFNMQALAQNEKTDAEKTALIKEMFDLMEMDKMFDQMTTMMAGNFKTQLPALMENIAKNMGDSSALSDKQKSVLFEEVMPSYMEKVMKRALGVFNMNKMVEEVYVPLYAKHFTLEDITAINAFYKSPAGKKTIEATPAIAAEAMGMIMKLYVPDMINEMKALNKEFAEELRQKLELDEANYKSLLKELNVE
jgi:hypothetical protein